MGGGARRGRPHLHAVLIMQSLAHAETSLHGQREDARLVVDHVAPGLLRGVRGGAAKLVGVPLRTAVAIPYAPPGFLGPPRSFPGIRGNKAFAEGGGRMWRAVGGHSDPWVPAPLAMALHALSDPRTGHPGIRRQLQALALQPIDVAAYPDDRLLEIDLAGPSDEPRLELDLRAKAGAALVERAAGSLVHDGMRLLMEVPQPHVFMDEDIGCSFEADPDEGTPPYCPVTAWDGMREYAAYLDTLTGNDHDLLCREADAVGRAVEGLAPRPLSDVTHFAEVAAPRLLDFGVSAARKWPRVREDPATLTALRALRSVAVAASGRLVAPGDLPDAVAAIRCAAVALERTCPYASLAEAVAETMLSYVDRVAVPRLAARPVPDDDAQFLDALTP
jgi:hypothetical protein